MHFDWNEDTIRWFVDASNYTGYHRRLTEKIAPLVNNYITLCDIGCGLGILDIYLAPYIQSITCFDINENALNYLKEAVRQNNISNIQIDNRNCDSLRDSFDCILLSFFGSRNLGKFLPHCKKLIVITGGENTNHMYPTNDKEEKETISSQDKPAKLKQEHTNKQKKKNNYMEVEKYLKNNQIPYKLQTHILDFGQPFLTIADAHKFAKNLSSEAAEEEINEFIEKNLKKQEGEFPYFMAHEKEIGIFEITGKL